MSEINELRDLLVTSRDSTKLIVRVYFFSVLTCQICYVNIKANVFTSRKNELLTILQIFSLNNNNYYVPVDMKCCTKLPTLVGPNMLSNDISKVNSG